MSNTLIETTMKTYIAPECEQTALISRESVLLNLSDAVGGDEQARRKELMDWADNDWESVEDEE